MDNRNTEVSICYYGKGSFRIYKMFVDLKLQKGDLHFRYKNDKYYFILYF